MQGPVALVQLPLEIVVPGLCPREGLVHPEHCLRPYSDPADRRRGGASRQPSSSTEHGRADASPTGEPTAKRAWPCGLPVCLHRPTLETCQSRRSPALRPGKGVWEKRAGGGAGAGVLCVSLGTREAWNLGVGVAGGSGPELQPPVPCVRSIFPLGLDEASLPALPSLPPCSGPLDPVFALTIHLECAENPNLPAQGPGRGQRGSFRVVRTVKSEGIPKEEALPPAQENPNLQARRPAEWLFPVKLSVRSGSGSRGPPART
ncbi:unnamed protein product [Rangifer tarandus platyrhynchus]|uniref:Uncharacterized protein n=2 Tax=Rangifer tarandus platyrhynchus TaxID=3082113 RepID=A0ACB0FG84_RANTA|nr:unnamed protein product [Rangifer tarandus platyrhynchus]CAI9712082.1 unnamed protein product [Rangifer tarandus platyrhynchus]